MASYKKIKDIDDESMRLRVTDKLLALRKQLREEIPEKTATETLLLATWNIREFGDNRLEESCYYIAEIIDHFDLVVLQEVNSKKLQGLKSVMSILGDNWTYMMSDGVDGSAGGNEAMAFVFNTNKVQFTGLCGEIVLPFEKLIQTTKRKKKNGVKVEETSSVQFARTPYIASFRAGWFDFNLCTVHIYYGDDSNDEKTDAGSIKRRVDEIKTITSTLLKRQDEDGNSYIILGDFNIPDTDGEYFNALIQSQKFKKTARFFIPEEIRKYPTDMGQVSHYDQIAFSVKLEDNMTIFDEKEQKAGAFNFTKSVYSEEEWAEYLPYYKAVYEESEKKNKTEASHYKLWRTFQMSDHMPLWVEMKIDFSDQYLKTHTK